MSFGEPLAPARAGDRRRAKTMIESAFAAGRLTPPDRDLRLDQVRTASTQGELDGLVRDLRGAPARLSPMLPVPPGSSGLPPGSSVGASGPGSVLPVPQGSGSGTSSSGSASGWGDAARRRTSPIPALIGFAGVLVVGVMAISTLESHQTQEATAGPGPFGGGPGGGAVVQTTPRFALTARGLGRLVRDVHSSFGRTTVGGATLYPRYAVLDVALPDRPRLVRSYTYRGDGFDAALGRRRAEGEVDLAEIRVEALMENLAQAPERVGVRRLDGRYVLVLPDEGGTLWIYVTSSSGRTGYVVTTLDGRVLREMPAT